MSVKGLWCVAASAVLVACSGGSSHSNSGVLDPALSGTWYGTTTVAIPGYAPFSYPSELVVSVAGGSASVSQVCPSGGGTLTAFGTGDSAQWNGSLVCPPVVLGQCSAVTLTLTSATAMLDGTTFAAQGSGVATGCGVSSNVTLSFAGTTTPPCAPRTITVEWSSFVGGDGIARACTQAGVASVDISMDGSYVSTWPCTDGGAVITNVPSGTSTLTVEGIEQGGRIAYRDEFDVNAASCGDRLVQAQPAEGWVDVNYAFQGGGNCVGTVQNPSYMWFSAFDKTANAVAAEVSERTPSFETQYWCGVYASNPDPTLAAHALFIPLPAGTYTMDWIEEHASPLVAPNYGVVGAHCTPFDFNVPGGTTTTVPTTPVVLADTSTICTHP